MEYVLRARQIIPKPLSEVFAFFAEPANLARITPPWLGFAIVAPAQPVMAQGLTITYRVQPLLIPQRWVSQITVYEPPYRFVDEQRAGPYKRWYHEHRFRDVPEGTEVIDEVTYELPFGILGSLAHGLLVRRQLRAIFRYRERMISTQSGVSGANAEIEFVRRHG